MINFVIFSIFPFIHVSHNLQPVNTTAWTSAYLKQELSVALLCQAN